MTRKADRNTRLACQAHYADIARLLAWISQASRNYTKDDPAWAHPGVLHHIRDRLIEDLGFLTGDEPGAIEERLAALAADSHSRKT